MTNNNNRSLSLSESNLTNTELFIKGFQFVGTTDRVNVTPNIIAGPETKDRQYLESFDGLHTNGIGTSVMLDVPGTIQALPFILGFMKGKGLEYFTIGTTAKIKDGYVPNITTSITFYDVDPEAIGLEGYDLDPDQIEVLLAKVEEAVYADNCRQETAKLILAAEKHKIDSLLEHLVDVDEWQCKDPCKADVLAEHRYRVPGETTSRIRQLVRLSKDIVLLENGGVLDHGINAVLRF